MTPERKKGVSKLVRYVLSKMMENNLVFFFHSAASVSMAGPGSPSSTRSNLSTVSVVNVVYRVDASSPLLLCIVRACKYYRQSSQEERLATCAEFPTSWVLSMCMYVLAGSDVASVDGASSCAPCMPAVHQNSAFFVVQLYFANSWRSRLTISHPYLDPILNPPSDTTFSSCSSSLGWQAKRTQSEAPCGHKFRVYPVFDEPRGPDFAPHLGSVLHWVNKSAGRDTAVSCSSLPPSTRSTSSVSTMLARATAVLAALHALDTQTYAFVPSAVHFRAASQHRTSSASSAAGAAASYQR